MRRQEVEACDYFGGFIVIQSVAGGTGSGLGACARAASRRIAAGRRTAHNRCVAPLQALG
jgi:tubulin delta